MGGWDWDFGGWDGWVEEEEEGGIWMARMEGVGVVPFGIDIGEGGDGVVLLVS